MNKIFYGIIWLDAIIHGKLIIMIWAVCFVCFQAGPAHGGILVLCPQITACAPSSEKCAPPSENCAPKESNRPGATGVHFGVCAPPKILLVPPLKRE